MKFSTKQLNYNDILQYVSEEDIAMFYLGVGVKSTFYSFFREESNPGRYLYYKKGRMHYFDCFESRSLPYLIMELNHWSYKEFIDHLKTDLLNKVSTTSQTKKCLKSPIIDSSTPTEIKIKKRPWRDYDIEYWNQFGISIKTLELFNVCPIEFFWINGRLFVADKLCYSYNFYWENNVYRRKIYSPYSENKWWANGGKVAQGEIMLPYSGDLLIVTKSFKDVICLFELGFIAVAPPSEISFLPQEYFNKQKERFKRIILFFDNDFTGIKKSEEFSQKYNLEYILINEDIKDISDYVKTYNKEKAKELLNKLIYGTN